MFFRFIYIVPLSQSFILDMYYPEDLIYGGREICLLGEQEIFLDIFSPTTNYKHDIK